MAFSTEGIAKYEIIRVQICQYSSVTNVPASQQSCLLLPRFLGSLTFFLLIKRINVVGCGFCFHKKCFVTCTFMSIMCPTQCIRSDRSNMIKQKHYRVPLVSSSSERLFLLDLSLLFGFIDSCGTKKGDKKTSTLTSLEPLFQSNKQ